MLEYQSVSLKGKQHVLRALRITPNAAVIIEGRFLRVGRVYDEFWLESKDIPEPQELIKILRGISDKPDIFTFAQKLPNSIPKYPYFMEWDNLAVASFSSYDEWFRHKINKGARSSIRKAIKEDIRTEIVSFSDDLVRGISLIYNESPIRQGRRFWHYAKPFAFVKEENSSYLDKSVFIGAFYKNELVGFLKLVLHDEVASIMQIISKKSYFQKCPTNALLSRAIEVCVEKRIYHLTYEKFIYGKNEGSTLLNFKRNNGFERIEIPRYYIPLSLRGMIALRLGLHKGFQVLIPAFARTCAIALRSAINKLRSR